MSFVVQIPRSARPRVNGGFLLSLGLLAIAVFPQCASGASAPVLTVTSTLASPTNFAPGDSTGRDIYTVQVTNISAVPTDGTPITVTDDLPPGLTVNQGKGLPPEQRFYIFNDAGFYFPGEETHIQPVCEPGPPATCTVFNEVLRPNQRLQMLVPVNVAASAAPVVSNRVTVSGGGAPGAVSVVPTTISSAPSPFGFQSILSSLLTGEGNVATQAGSHPYQLRVGFQLNTNLAEGRQLPAANPRFMSADLPPGVVVDPRATPILCTEAQLEASACPDASAVGVVDPTISGGFRANADDFASLYNVVPPPGSPASLGFNVSGLGIFVHLLGRVRSDGDYGLSADAADIPQFGALSGFRAEIWGDPTDPSHDHSRGSCAGTHAYLNDLSCPVARSETPFLTLPSACSGQLSTTIRATSWQEPEAPPISATSETMDSFGNPVGVTGCGSLDFSPSISARTEAASSDSPTGLHVGVRLPQATGQSSLAEANLRDTVIALPRGLAVNPSAADGLAACSEAQVGYTGIKEGRQSFSAAPAACPEASKLGSVSISTPLLDHPLPGAIYLAKQGENPFGSLLALYLTVDDPATGVVIKLPGKVTPDPVTGQLTASFEENPQLPFEDLNVDFFGGPRAALTTPPTCGTYTTTSDLTPWTAPEGADAHPSDSFSVSSSPAGGCATTEAAMPNTPAFEAGSTNPLAGAYSPFVLKIKREDGSQRLSQIDTTLPAGLVGKLAGIPYCPAAAIATATARANPGQGAAELSSPSCPAASEVGTVNVGAGSGTPFYVQGHVYLAGPYKGAPLSLAIITPAVAGPFDLGDVVVRVALFVDPTTAQIHAVSDPLPTILQGIPLDIRSVALNLNRSQFTLNPTSCEAASITGQLTSTTGAAAPLKNAFQVAGCNGLAFKPKLSLKLSGSTQRGKNPALKAVLTQPSGQANIAKVSVVLPKSEFIDNRHINAPCTRVQFNAGPGNGAQCPAKSILGYARAFTPLLDKPLEGPVYFRSNGGERELPDLVASLDGQVHLNVVGFIDSVHKKGAEVSRTRNTFAMVPDAPVSKFVLSLKGGNKGLLQNSANLCKVKNVAQIKLTGQNGKHHDFGQTIGNGCGGKGKKGPKGGK